MSYSGTLFGEVWWNRTTVTILTVLRSSIELTPPNLIHPFLPTIPFIKSLIGWSQRMRPSFVTDLHGPFQFTGLVHRCLCLRSEICVLGSMNFTELNLTSVRYLELFVFFTAYHPTIPYHTSSSGESMTPQRTLLTVKVQVHSFWRLIRVTIPWLFLDRERCYHYTNEPYVLELAKLQHSNRYAT